MAKIDSLTSLRAFAAGALLYYHQMRVIIGVDPVHEFANGVSFFFVLSGFILAVNYPRLDRDGLRRFFLARFARLYPVHIFTLVLFALAFAPMIFFDRTQQGIITLNALLLQAWVPMRGYIFSMNSVSWSVSAEFFFYLCFPLLIMARRPGLAFAGLLLATIAAILLTDTFVTDVHADFWEWTPAEMLVNTPYFRLTEFACGIWFASLYQRGFLKRFAGMGLEIAAVVGVVLVASNTYALAAWFMRPEDLLLGVWLRVAGAMLVFGVLILVLAYQAGAIGRFLQSRVMVLLGETSFALYMVHSIVLNVVVVHNVLPDAHWAVRFTIVTVGSYVASYLIWRFIEKPSRARILRTSMWRSAPSTT